MFRALFYLHIVSFSLYSWVCKTLNKDNLNLIKNEDDRLTLSTITKFLESSCILLPRRNSEFGLTPGDRRRQKL